MQSSLCQRRTENYDSLQTFRPTNEVTIKDRYPLPLISELQDQLRKAKWFTALDLKGAFNLIRMKEGEEWKTAIRTQRGLFEYTVMPMGLTNAPATFQRMINNVLKEYLDKFVIAYLDDILIYSETLEEHKQHVHKVLQTLLEAKLLVEPEKAKFHVQEVEFLGHVIKPGRLEMQPSKIQAILDWPTPTCVKDIQAFAGLANYYRQYIKGFGEIRQPMDKLTRKDTPFKWEKPQQDAFDEIKRRVASKPVIATPNPELAYIIEADASGKGIGAVASQRNEQGELHPIAFYSRALKGPELNYGIPDQELLAIVEAFKEWKVYLIGAKHKITVYSDHKNLTSFTTTKDLNKRQVRWWEFLSEFDFDIIYRKGSENARADALSRRADYMATSDSNKLAILATNKDGSLTINKGINAIYRDEHSSEWDEKLIASYKDDQLLQNWNENPLITKGELFYRYKGKTYVPTQLQHELVKDLHELPAHGHQGVTKTLRTNQEKL